MENDNRGFWRATGEYLGFVSPKQVAVPQKRAVDGPAAGVIPPSRSTLLGITPDEALTIGAVHRAISIITASVAQMDLGVFRDGVELKAPPIIKQPNLDDTQTAFIEETVYSLAAYGNAYWRTYGEPVANVEVLDPASVTITTEKGGRKAYWVGAEEVPATQIKHLKLFRKPGHLKGYGPIQHGQSELVGALKLRSFADNWFGQSSVPTGVLTTDQVLSPEEAAEFAKSWQRFLNENGIPVMSQGMHYDYLGIKPAEAQYLEVQQAQVNAIARLFGVPAILLGSGLEGTSTTYINAQELNIQFLQTTLVKYMNEIEEALSSLLPRGQKVEFKEDSLLRMNTALEVDVQAKQIQAGIVSADEVRKEKGLPPLPKATNAPAGPVEEKNPNKNTGENK